MSGVEISALLIQQVWEKGEIITEYAKDEWRRDSYGQVIRREDYERKNSVYGWAIECVNPVPENTISCMYPLNYKNKATDYCDVS